MFQGLRQSSLFYILEKGEQPTLKVGQVESVSNPTAKYSQYPLYGQQEYVDIRVKVGSEQVDFKQLPAQLSIANCGTGEVVVSESREAMAQEVDAMLRNSRAVIDSVPYHKRVVDACEGMMRELNPQLAKEQKQEEKIGDLEKKMSGIESKLTDMMKMLSTSLKKS